MAEEYRLEDLLKLRTQRVESGKRNLHSKQLALQEQQRRLEQLLAEGAPEVWPSRVEGRAVYTEHCRKAIEALQHEIEQSERDLEAEQKELWVLQLHKEKWLADQG